MISKIERQFFDTFGIEPKTNQVYIDEFFNKQLSNILEKVKLNELGWKYDEEFWNEFILQEIKNV